MNFPAAVSPFLVDESDPIAPEVTVIVPTFNSAQTITRCLAALAAQQTQHRFEVVVVNSGTDDTRALATRALPGCRTLQLPTHAVAAVARHHGVMVARGRILAFVDSDIYVSADWIEHVWRAADIGADLICGSIENGNPASAVSRAEQLLMFNEFLPDAPERASWFALSGNMVMSRETYNRFGPFVPVRAAEDVVFSRKLIAAGGTIVFYPRLKVVHENRTHVRAYIRNQFVIGRHTALARRLVPFADVQSYRLFLLMLPVAPVAKLAKIVVRFLRWKPANVWPVLKELPLLSVGLCACSAGMVDAVMSPGLPPDGDDAQSAANQSRQTAVRKALS